MWSILLTLTYYTGDSCSMQLVNGVLSEEMAEKIVIDWKDNIDKEYWNVSAVIFRSA